MPKMLCPFWLETFQICLDQTVTESLIEKTLHLQTHLLWYTLWSLSLFTSKYWKILFVNVYIDKTDFSSSILKLLLTENIYTFKVGYIMITYHYLFYFLKGIFLATWDKNWQERMAGIPYIQQEQNISRQVCYQMLVYPRKVLILIP